MSSTLKTPKSFQPLSKDVKYLNRDFLQFKESLINFSKTYFPNTYKDFSDSSPGMMFIEMASYVGDVLSFYTDYIFKEGLINSVNERKNLISLIKSMGYKVKPSRAATSKLDIFQLIPSKEDSSGNFIPDNKYALIIKENMQVANSFGSYYLLNDSVNFAINTKLSPRESSVFSRSSNGTPQFFLLKKTSKISSGKIVTKSFNIGSPTPFLKLFLDETNVLEILEIKDSDDNKWYEVDYLAQELVLDSVPNDVLHEGSLSIFNDEVPYILQYRRTSRRFTVNVDANNLTYIEFGSGTVSISDEIVNLSSQSVGAGLSKINSLNIPFDPSNFIKNETYGIAPSNTTLIVTYVVGGGISSNVPSGDINTVVSVDYDNSMEGLSPDEVNLFGTVKASLKVNNPLPAVGGKDAETNEEIRQNALSLNAAQNRAVTKDDYLVRVYSLPPKFGSIAKAQAIPNNGLGVDTKKVLSGTIDINNDLIIPDKDVSTFFRKVYYDINNPFAINLYLLSYDSNKNLTTVNEALIQNLIKYLKHFRILTDGVNFIDGYIINIGVNFSIAVYKNFNKKDVLLKTIRTVQDFFDIDKWNFSQPINISQLELSIANIEGVQSVASIEIVNKTVVDSSNYSSIEYDIKGATKNKIIYPPVDPAVWEVKFPDKDIKGSCI